MWVKHQVSTEVGKYTQNRRPVTNRFIVCICSSSVMLLSSLQLPQPVTFHEDVALRRCQVLSRVKFQVRHLPLNHLINVTSKLHHLTLGGPRAYECLNLSSSGWSEHYISFNKLWRSCRPIFLRQDKPRNSLTSAESAQRGQWCGWYRLILRCMTTAVLMTSSGRRRPAAVIGASCQSPTCAAWLLQL